MSEDRLYDKIDWVLGGVDRSIDMDNQTFNSKLSDSEPSTGDK